METNEDNKLILNYLTSEEGQNPTVAAILLAKVTKYDDIKQDFLRWLKERNYDSSLRINNYTPQQISELAPALHGIGVYNFMVTLRDDPDSANQIIKEGFIAL